MYYLLEDNSIIETEKEYEVEYIKDTYFNSQNEYKFVYVKELHYQGLQVLRNSTTEENIGFIKKQSENVYDLIEVGDIVKYYGNLYEVKKFEIYHEIVYMDTAIGLCMPSVNRLTELLKAIYKQDENGNYIKVWEVKEDE